MKTNEAPEKIYLVIDPIWGTMTVNYNRNDTDNIEYIRKDTFVEDVWKTVDNINPPQADRNKIYCVFTKDRYILATVINHPKDEELLQWKCTEFPFHRYDICEGDKYMQIV